MKTLQEIKDEYAKSLGYKDWEDLQYFDYDIVNTDEVIHEIAKRYARECAKATLEKAAESVITYHNPDDHKSVKVYRIHKTQESITNEENIVIL